MTFSFNDKYIGEIINVKNEKAAKVKNRIEVGLFFINLKIILKLITVSKETRAAKISGI